MALNPQAIREGWAPDITDEMSKEDFINKIKIDKKFTEELSQRFAESLGVEFKIEEQELSLEERVNLLKTIDSGLIPTSKLMQSIVEPILNEHNIPTKLITLTYQNESIQSYE